MTEITLRDVIAGKPVENAYHLAMVMWDIPSTMNRALEVLERRGVLNATVVIPTNYRIVHKDEDNDHD